MVSASGRLARAYSYCERLAREHYENFPVASLVLPARMRPHIAAIYAFARRADDFADEPGIATAERFRLLDDWTARLQQAIEPEGKAAQGAGSDDDLVFVALGETIRRCSLPPVLFTDLLSAFRQDITTTRYATWADVLDYCSRSANPVGRLVLRVAGYNSAPLDRASDALCTALQLTNFWQDLGRDFSHGRLYIPLEDLQRAGASEVDLECRKVTAEWRSVMWAAIERTRRLFDSGRVICDGVHGRLRWELRFTWLGGVRILDKVGRARLQSFDARPALSARDVPALLRAAVFWRTERGASSAAIAG